MTTGPLTWAGSGHFVAPPTGREGTPLGEHSGEEHVRRPQGSHTGLDTLSCTRRVPLSEIPAPVGPQRLLSPAQSPWSQSANLLHPTCDLWGSCPLCSGDPALSAASSCQPAPRTVRTAVLKPSFLPDATAPSEAAPDPLLAPAGHLQSHFAHLASLTASR